MYIIYVYLCIYTRIYPLLGPPGGAAARGEERGLLLPVERLHAVLRPARAAHRAHLHLPGADEPALQDPGPGPLTPQTHTHRDLTSSELQAEGFKGTVTLLFFCSHSGGLFL